MDEIVFKILFEIVLLCCKSNQTIPVNKHFHRRYNLGNKNVNSKIIFMAHVQSGSLYILLYYIQILRSFYLLQLDFIFLFLAEGAIIVFYYVYFLVHLNVLIHFDFLLVVNFVEIRFDLFYVLRNKYTTSLRT
jgi:hypothetical protein